MVKREYKFCFYINARHKMQFFGEESKIHPHTWELVIYLMKNSEEFVRFTDIEVQIQSCLLAYEDKLLNDLEEFAALEPTTENIGEILYKNINGILIDTQWSLVSFEISENPNRTYIISNLKYQENESRHHISTASIEHSKTKPINISKIVSLPSLDEMFSVNEVAAHEEETGRLSDDMEDHTSNCLATVDESTSTSKEKWHVNIGMPDFNKLGKEIAKTPRRKILLSTAILLCAGLITILYLLRGGIYPWGTDLYGHLYKGHFLYEEFIKGNIFPLYSDHWYNGIQLFRYWPPMTYYMILVMELITQGDVLTAYFALVFFIFIGGGFAWILWGAATGRNRLGLCIALLWFFLPDNIRVLFAEGNLPRVIITNTFPYLLLAIWQYFQTRKKRYILSIFLLGCFITFTHAMISAMVGLTLFIFSFLYGMLNNKKREVFEITIAALFGIALAGIWLYPAFKGGMLSMDKEAVAQISNSLTFPITQSLNPFYTLKQADAFYFGLSTFIICICGLLYSPTKSKAGFAVAVIVFFGTTKALLPILSKLPMSQLFWMMRFVPLALACLLCGVFLWHNLKKKVLIFFILIMLLDCINPLKMLFYTTKEPKLSKELKIATAAATHRVAMIDLSAFGSYPSFYISYNDMNKDLKQTFGWAWQGAKTGSNIVGLNTAIEKSWYEYFFDRALELGIDTLLVKKDDIKQMDEFLLMAGHYEFMKIHESNNSMILHKNTSSDYGTKVTYEGLGIGKYASNITYMFPKFQVGNSVFIDDYSVQELLKYKSIYMAGFRYKDKQKSEEIIKEISRKGVKVVVDLTNADVDLYTSRAEFLEVAAQPIRFYDSYGQVSIKDTSMSFTEFPRENREWNTIYLENLDVVQGSATVNNQIFNCLGTKYNDNIHFVGFNLPYFALVTKDDKAMDILQSITGITSRQAPDREIVQTMIESGKDYITITAQEENTFVPVAALDAFETVSGSYQEIHNLIVMKEKTLKLKLKYPYFKQGLAVSIFGLLGFTAFYWFYFRKRKKAEKVMLPSQA